MSIINEDDIFMMIIFTHSKSAYVGRRGYRIFDSVCLSVCLSVFCLCVCLQHNSETNDPKVFKLGVGNYLEIYWKCYAFGLKGQRFKVTGSISPFCILELRFIDIR